MSRLLFSSVSVSALLFGSVAAQDDVVFTGTVTGSCTIVVDTGGTLGVSTDFTQLSSQETGGSAGSATVTASDTSFNINLAAATAFDASPAGGNTNTTFAAEYDASGATTASDVTAGTPTSLATGVTTVSVDASADKTTGIFDAGTYTMTATLTCAP